MPFKMEFKTNGDDMMRGQEQSVFAMLDFAAKGVLAGKTRDMMVDGNGNVLGEWSLTWDYSHPEPDADDDTWNDYQDEWAGTDDAGEDVTERVHYRWSEYHNEWYVADQVEWNDKEGDYVPK